eukprot:1289380-Lingulodinium_polyedra.AAC.1
MPSVWAGRDDKTLSYAEYKAEVTNLIMALDPEDGLEILKQVEGIPLDGDPEGVDAWDKPRFDELGGALYR